MSLNQLRIVQVVPSRLQIVPALNGFKSAYSFYGQLPKIVMELQEVHEHLMGVLDVEVMVEMNGKANFSLTDGDILLLTQVASVIHDHAIKEFRAQALGTEMESIEFGRFDEQQVERDVRSGKLVLA